MVQLTCLGSLGLALDYSVDRYATGAKADREGVIAIRLHVLLGRRSDALKAE